ncbi:MAG: hypothetical protein QOH46_166 [Solirubrobacteraceae bacterium]|jgi:hypothetical protein|nr:hypothetical protein [Solirubrobacteraceae bacterium]
MHAGEAAAAVSATTGGEPAAAADPFDEGLRIVRLAGEADLDVRLLGGVAVGLRCPSARRAPLARTYKDIDFIARGRDRRRVEDLFSAAGYRPETEFNTLHGQHRLFFFDPHHEREADVFLDVVSMCHELDLRERVAVAQETLPLADLLMLKLQVVEAGERDLKDAVALIADHGFSQDGIDLDYIGAILGGDWGWWRTATLALERLEKFARELPGLERRDVVAERIREALQSVEAAPKTRRWKLRAKVGTRVRWYELPEEAL